MSQVKLFFAAATYFFCTTALFFLLGEYKQAFQAVDDALKSVYLAQRSRIFFSFHDLTLQCC